MKTVLGLTVVGVPMVMAAAGELSPGMLTLGILAALACWLVSGWFAD